MTRTYSWLVDRLSRQLEPDERDAVCGDFAESGVAGGTAFRNMLGLVVRRQFALWKSCRPWLGLAGLVAPVGVLLVLFASKVVGALGQWVWNNAEYGSELVSWEYSMAAVFMCTSVSLILWAWTSGFVLGSLARRTVWVHGAVFFLALSGFDIWMVSKSSLTIAVPALMAQVILLLLPAISGVRGGRRIGTLTVGQAVALALAVVTAQASWILIGIWGLSAGGVRWLELLLGFGVLSWPTGYIVATAARQRKLQNLAV